ncbi:MAG TPA: MEDS domain-containing protein [Aestuariivirga sp.]|nr:MEDS domain-containing protein [Aestuariivirga sp.]
MISHAHKINRDTERTDPAEERRPSGIPVIGEMLWGTHICVFYETEQDLLDTTVTYFEAGLEANEFCIWALPDPLDGERARDALRRSIPDFDRRLESGQMELIPGADWYLHGGKFDLQQITGGWNEKLRMALAKGFAGVRGSGNAFWIGTNHWKNFYAYEEELDRTSRARRWSSSARIRCRRAESAICLTWRECISSLSPGDTASGKALRHRSSSGPSRR